MFDWICALTVHCLTCQSNKTKPKHRIEVPLEEWQSEFTPFGTIHIDNKRPLHPQSDQNLDCFLVLDAYSRFLMVHTVTNTGAQTNFSVVEKWTHSFGIPQSFVLDQGTAFKNTDFINWTKNWESLCEFKQHTRLGLMKKIKLKINKLPLIGGTS